MIHTSSYKDFQLAGFRRFSISRDKGASAGYEGDCFEELAPKREFWRTWRENIGKISEEENTRYYIEEYYKQVLSKLDPEEVYHKLDYSTLLCYEAADEFCHRHVVAAWFNLLLGNSIEPVTEIALVDGQLKVVGDMGARYSDILEDVIRKNENMHGFTSVRARYLFDQGEKLEALAGEKERQYPGSCYDSLRQCACFRRCDADAVEEEYRAQQKKKTRREGKKND